MFVRTSNIVRQSTQSLLAFPFPCRALEEESELRAVKNEYEFQYVFVVNDALEFIFFKFRFIFFDILIPLKPMDVYAPEITQSPYLSMYVPKQADLTESFTSQKSSSA